MTEKPITAEEAKKEEDRVAEKKGNQERRVQAYLKATSFVSFWGREDFYNYYAVKPVVAETAKKAVPKRAAKTTASADTNKDNGVSYHYKSGKQPDKKIKVPTTGGDAPLVNSKTTKRKKWMIFRVPSYMPSAAVALWINTAFDANRRPAFFCPWKRYKDKHRSDFHRPVKVKSTQIF
jgi:hypothetical protein